jgi:hypothetical protein
MLRRWPERRWPPRLAMSANHAERASRCLAGSTVARRRPGGETISAGFPQELNRRTLPSRSRPVPTLDARRGNARSRPIRHCPSVAVDSVRGATGMSHKVLALLVSASIVGRRLGPCSTRGPDNLASPRMPLGYPLVTSTGSPRAVGITRHHYALLSTWFCRPYCDSDLRHCFKTKS